MIFDSASASTYFNGRIFIRPGRNNRGGSGLIRPWPVSQSAQSRPSETLDRRRPRETGLRVLARRLLKEGYENGSGASSIAKQRLSVSCGPPTAHGERVRCSPGQGHARKSQDWRKRNLPAAGGYGVADDYSGAGRTTKGLVCGVSKNSQSRSNSHGGLHQGPRD